MHSTFPLSYYNQPHASGSKSPQSSFDSGFVLPLEAHDGCGGLEGAKMFPIGEPVGCRVCVGAMVGISGATGATGADGNVIL